MKSYVIGPNEANQRLDKFIKKVLKEAPTSFVYKMLRKKNITLNGKRATGNEKLEVKDEVKFFLADETFDKFAGSTVSALKNSPLKTTQRKLDVIFENDHILLLNKPAGILSQKAGKKDLSINDMFLDYLLDKGVVTTESLATFKPSICNRLDRNTSGLMIAGKSLSGLQEMSRVLKDRSLEKYYLCIVKGMVSKPQHVRGYLSKDHKSNQVQIFKETPDIDADPIETSYEPIAYNNQISLIKVHLITGKTHQIRAHLASIGHPIIGDPKYGDLIGNELYKKQFFINRQLLHSYQVVFPSLLEELQELTGKSFYANIPKDFRKILKETTWQHGIQEVLEVLH